MCIFPCCFSVLGRRFFHRFFEALAEMVLVVIAKLLGYAGYALIRILQEVHGPFNSSVFDVLQYGDAGDRFEYVVQVTPTHRALRNISQMQVFESPTPIYSLLPPNLFLYAWPSPSRIRQFLFCSVIIKICSICSEQRV